jgi:hypothetical protein
MQRWKATGLTTGLICWLFAGTTIFGQTGSAGAPPGPAIGVRAIIHSVADLQKTVTFYHDGLGMAPLGANGQSMPALPAANPLNESALEVHRHAGRQVPERFV